MVSRHGRVKMRVRPSLGAPRVRPTARAPGGVTPRSSPRVARAARSAPRAPRSARGPRCRRQHRDRPGRVAGGPGRGTLRRTWRRYAGGARARSVGLWPRAGASQGAYSTFMFFYSQFSPVQSSPVKTLESRLPLPSNSVLCLVRLEPLTVRPPAGARCPFPLFHFTQTPPPFSRGARAATPATRRL